MKQSIERDVESAKQVERDFSTVSQQKDQVLELLSKIQTAFPTQTLRDTFGAIVESIHETFKVEREFTAVEDEVLQKEAELRAYAKKEVEGLLSQKVL